ncbi:MAG: ABC transporter permease subunit [Niameybacter sp.]|uniref:ABC transporter permease n=1 Tax=Niameybacter sp. TaxID=2033640 RepID=UPI002FCA749B
MAVNNMKVNDEKEMILNDNNKRLTKREKIMRNMVKYRYFYLMFLPVLLLLFLFNYLPMFGIRIAFYEWGLFGPVEFVGMENFKTIFQSNMFIRAFFNTLNLSFINLILSMICSVGCALLLNEVKAVKFKKITQTVLYLPHFLSWVVVASIFTMLLSPQGGMVNEAIKAMGGEPIYFLVSEEWWTPVYLFINRWKETGWSTIIFMTALTAVDQEMYEAAAIDGAARLKQTWYITLPAIQNTILVVFILNLAKVLNVFESVLVLYNPMVYDVADVIGTYTYRAGLLNADYGTATAVGLFKSIVSLVLVALANHLSKKIKGEGIL